MKRTVALLLMLAMLLSLAACGQNAESAPAPASSAAQEVQTTASPAEEKEAEASVESENAEAPAVPENLEDYDVRTMAGDWEYHDVCYVGIGEAKYVEVPYYSLENVVYCTDPVDDSYEIMNIYVPAAYMVQNEDGTCSINEKGLVGVMGEDGSTLMYGTQEAPIVYINTINGYAAGVAPTVSDGRMGNNAGYYYQFIEQGLILVTVAARGRTSTDEDGNMNGAVPAGLVDLKAGLRWLHYNDEFLAGDSNKIVTVGVSAGGGMSTMMGVSGNSPLFDSYLQEIGAADAPDDVWASLVYCPITNLDFADGVYWFEAGAKEGDDFDAALTREFLNEYVKYMQSLGFDLGDDGVSGAYYEDFLHAFEEAFDEHAEMDFKNEEDVQTYFEELNANGQWITYDPDKGTEITSLKDFGTYYWNGFQSYSQATVFDSLDHGSIESQVFEDKHFSWLVLNALETLKDDYPEAAEYYEAYKSDIESGVGETAKLYDPMTFIGQNQSDIAQHWRFNIGLEDTNVTHAMAWTVYNALSAMEDVDATYDILYGIGHQTVEYNSYDTISWIYETDLGVRPAYDTIKPIVTVAVEGGGGVQSPESVAGTYTLNEINGVGMEVTWTLELSADGTYVLSEVGVVEKSYTGNFCVVDGYVSCGPINEEDGPRGDAFGDGYISVWTLNEAAGTCEHADLGRYQDPATAGAPSSGGGAATDVTGTYTLNEVNAVGMEVTWTLELSADGTYVLSETGVVEMSYTGTYANNGTTVSCGPINEADGPRGDAFGDGYISVWGVDPDSGACKHMDLSLYQPPMDGAPGGETAAGVDVVGEYTLDEVNGVGMEISWTLELRADNTYVLSEVGAVEMSYTGSYSHDGVTVSCGPINEEDGPRGDAFGDGYISVWTVDPANGTCAHEDLGKYVAP